MELAPDEPTVISRRFKSASEFTGTLRQTAIRPTSVLGEPSQLNLVGSYLASRVPSSGSNGVLFCIAPKTVPSFGALV